MGHDLAEVQAVIWKSLLEDTAVQTLVGTRVSGEHPQLSGGAEAVFPSLVTELRGGVSGYAGAWTRNTFELWAYSRESMSEALRVHEAAYVVLQAQRLRFDYGAGATRSVVCQILVEPTTQWNETLRVHYCMSSWVARAVG